MKRSLCIENEYEQDEIKLAENGTFNFYDGIVTGKRGAGKSIEGNAFNMNFPQGYTLEKTYANGVDTAHLVK